MEVFSKFSWQRSFWWDWHNVKSIVQSQSAKKKGHNHCAVCKVFPSSCQQSNECYWGFLIDKTQVEAYRDTDPLDNCQTVPGIMSMHIISTGDDDVKLWKNASFSTRMSQTSLSISNISIQQKRKRCSIIQLWVTL